jgi:uncharacterized membrane protein
MKLIEDKKGVSVAMSIFVSFLIIVAYSIMVMATTPVLSEIIMANNDYLAANPGAENAGDWRISMNNALGIYSSSTFLLLSALIVWVIITAIKKQSSTYYLRR